jgi:hypothetical protein
MERKVCKVVRESNKISDPGYQRWYLELGSGEEEMEAARELVKTYLRRHRNLTLSDSRLGPFKDLQLTLLTSHILDTRASQRRSLRGRPKDLPDIEVFLGNFIKHRFARGS